jgi:threonine dehydrogenase-like Zn-dependent dehydrogenase
MVVGMPGIPRNVDWTPMWFKELTVKASYAYGPEQTEHGEKDTFKLAIDWMKDWGPRLAGMTGTPYDLADYRAALRSALNTGAGGIAKTIFVINKG